MTSALVSGNMNVYWVESRDLCPPPEREMEDHEQVVEVYSTWPREHSNVFLFKQNDKKYDLFEDPIVSHSQQQVWVDT